MGVLDRPLRRVASSLVSTFGASIVYRAVTRGTYNTETGKRETTTTDYSVRAVVGRVRQDLFGTVIKAGDWRVQIAALSLPVTPSTNDVMVVNGESLRIMQIDPVYSGDQVATYTVVGRR